MRDNIIKTVNENIKSMKFSTYEIDNENFSFKVDRSLFLKQEKLTNEIIEIGVDELFTFAIENIKDISKCIKKIDFDEPFKRSIVGKIGRLSTYEDFLAIPNQLYRCLMRAQSIQQCLNQLLKKIDIKIKQVDKLITNNDLSKETTNSKIILLSQIEGIKQIKLNVLNLIDSYDTILTHPTIKRFRYYWKNYETEDERFPIKCGVNDEISNITEYKSLLKIGNKNIIDIYNDLLTMVIHIENNSSTHLRFESRAVGTFLCLRETAYKTNIIDAMVSKLDYLSKLIENKKTNTINEREVTRFDSQLISISYIRNEFLKLQHRINTMMTDEKYIKYAKKSKVEDDGKILGTNSNNLIIAVMEDEKRVVGTVKAVKKNTNVDSEENVTKSR